MQALAAASYLSHTFIYNRFARAIAGLQAGPEPALEGELLDADPDSVAHHPVLSIDAFAEALRKTDDPICASLSWPKLGLESLYLYGLHLQGSTFALLVSREMDPRAPLTIIMVKEGDQRHPKLYMRCPVTGEHVSHLYYRDGRFASPKAQQLRYPSALQRAPKAAASSRNEQSR